VAEVRVRQGYYIDAIQLTCQGAAASPLRGGKGGGEQVFQLQPGERITAVSGSATAPGAPFVFSIQLHTDRRSSPEFGNHGPTKGQFPFRFQIPAGSASVDLSASRNSSSMRLAS
jgi:hypothetical protein